MAIINPSVSGSSGDSKKSTESQVNEKMQKGSPVNLLLIFLVIGLAVYGTFLNFQKGSVLNHTTDLEKEIKTIQDEIDVYRANKVEVSQNATEALAKIEAEEIRWSEVISEVNQLLPASAGGERLVEILSYSGSGQGRIALNAVTRPVAVPPFEDVAKLIATFNNSVFFKDVYVPSISKGQNEDGTSTLSFVLNMDYEKPETGSEDLIPVTSTDTKVPRIPTNN